MTIERVMGVGDADLKTVHLLRAVLGETPTHDDECITIEANLDDMNPEVAGFYCPVSSRRVLLMRGLSPFK